MKGKSSKQTKRDSKPYNLALRTNGRSTTTVQQKKQTKCQVEKSIMAANEAYDALTVHRVQSKSEEKKAMKTKVVQPSKKMKPMLHSVDETLEDFAKLGTHNSIQSDILDTITAFAGLGQEKTSEHGERTEVVSSSSNSHR